VRETPYQSTETNIKTLSKKYDTNTATVATPTLGHVNSIFTVIVRLRLIKITKRSKAKQSNIVKNG